MPDKIGYYLQFPLSDTDEQIRRRFVQKYGAEPTEIYTLLTKSGKAHSKMAGPTPTQQTTKQETPTQ